MGRELVKVPANYQHPKYTRDDAPFENRIGDYKALHRDFARALASFQKDIDEKGLAEAIEWHGGGPRRSDYVTFTPEEGVWFQVWETVSEGTPVTPAFVTRQGLIEYLVINGDFWDQNRRREGRTSIPCAPWTREQAEYFVNGDGLAPSMVMIDVKAMAGIEAITVLKP